MFLAESKLASSSVATVQTLTHIEELAGSKKKESQLWLEYIFQLNKQRILHECSCFVEFI